MKANLKVWGYIFISTFLLYSCNQEQKEFNQAKDSKSTKELKGFINSYPTSMYVDSASILIEELIWEETILENSYNSYEKYISNYPSGRYVNNVQERLKTKKESLELALETYKLAQLTSIKLEQEQLYYKTDSLFELANYAEFMLNVFKYPSKNLHFDGGGKNRLSEVVERPFTTSRYLYGRSATDYFDFILSNETVNKYICYKIMLASADKTHIKLSTVLIRNGKVVSTVDDNSFSVSSKYYGSHIGFIINNNINSMPNDKIRFKITASGSDYGKSCGNYQSYIKVGVPINTIHDTVLSERKKAIAWCISNSKWLHPNDVVLNFIAQLDYCVLNEKNGKWDIGWGSQKDGYAYQISWKDKVVNILEVRKDKASLIGIREHAMDFSIE